MHELSVIDNDSELFDPMNNWVKFNQASLRLTNEETALKKVDFDSTLMKLRKNTAMFPKKIAYNQNKKYSRNNEFVKRIKNKKK